MFKRIALTLTFLATFALVGLSCPSNAEARHSRGHRAHASYYYGRPHSYYGYYGTPYRTYYYYPPRVYRSYYYGPYYAPGYYYGYYGPGISIGVGF
jgi:hypothetical protein